MKTTKIFDKTAKAFKESKLVVSYGGSGSSKTISAMQLLFLLATHKKNLQIFMFAQTVPKLHNTLIEDFKRFVTGQDYFYQNFHNQSKTLEIKETGSKIIFASADDPGKVLGVRSDYILFDELNTFRHGKEIFKNLFARCRGVVVVTFNPASKFWITDYMSEKFATVIHSTYKDNPYIPRQTLNNLLYLSEKDENFKKVYLNGDWGALQGVVFKYKTNWNYFDDKPKRYDAKYYAGDFGYANDPSTLIEIIKNGNNLYLTEILYEKGLLNKEIAKICKKKIGNKHQIVFDSAEPKSIAELRRLKVKALTAVKGKDSIKKGIDTLKSYNLFLNRMSKNLINEFFNYKYAIDKTGEILNIPEDKFNHLIDPARYIVLKYRL